MKTTVIKQIEHLIDVLSELPDAEYLEALEEMERRAAAARDAREEEIASR